MDQRPISSAWQNGIHSPAGQCAASAELMCPGGWTRLSDPLVGASRSLRAGVRRPGQDWHTVRHLTSLQFLNRRRGTLIRKRNQKSGKATCLPTWLSVPGRSLEDLEVGDPSQAGGLGTWGSLI